MRYRGYRVDVIIAIALLTVPILLGAQSIHRQIWMERPLSKDLQAIAGVKTATVNRKPDRYDIILNLLIVDSLPIVYRQAVCIAEKHLKSLPFSIQLIDNRTPNLEDLYWQMQIYIEEAVMLGNFGAAATNLHRLAFNAGAETQFYVDKDHIYLELRQNETYLYAVRERIIPHKEVKAL
ncbi:MAG TPA: hypothetical protein VJ036_02800 [bacterium]|jgi:hypothetical protein|nr:hypothetical protein [bacterium]